MELFKDATLREIAEKLESIEEIDGIVVDAATGEIIPPQIWDKLTATREQKIRAYIAVIKDLRAKAAMHEEEAERQQKRAKAQKNRAAYLASILQSVLDGETFESVEGRVSYRDTPGRVLITDAGKIPGTWVLKMNPVFNTHEMNAYLKMGGEIPGAELVKERKMKIT